jgi:hypothetical protein
MSPDRASGMLPADDVIQEASKEVTDLPNPLSIGVTLGGLLLDVIVPRPKPRTGLPPEPTLPPRRADLRTPWSATTREEHDGPPVVSGAGTPMRVG